MNDERSPLLIIGGTFDPVHNGHIKIAKEIEKLFPDAEIKFMPVGIPSHRQSTYATPEQRLEMLKIALKPYKKFNIDQREIKKTTPSYSIESVEEIKQQQPIRTLIWIMGRDAYAHLNSWHRANELKNYCHLIIVERPGFDVNQEQQIYQKLGYTKVETADQLLEQDSAKILYLASSMLDMSSTQVRENITIKGNIELLDKNVNAYIAAHNLYQ